MKKKKPFKAFFIFELKQLLTTRNKVLLVIFALISLYFVQVGSSSYREQLEIKQEAKEISHKEVLPAVSVLFYNNIRDSKILLKRGLSPTDFFGWLYLVGSLVILFYGYETFRDISIMRMLLGQMGRRRLFLTTIGSRYVMIFLVFLPFLVLAAFLIFANGIEFSRPDFVTAFRFVVLWLVFSAVFFVSGALMGLLPSSVAGKSGKASVFAVWVGFVYLYPLALDSIVINPIDLSFVVGILTMLCLFGLLSFISNLAFFNQLFSSRLDARTIQEFIGKSIIIHPGKFNPFLVSNRATTDLFIALVKLTRQDIILQGLQVNMVLGGRPFPWQFKSSLKPGKVNLQYLPPPGSLAFDGTTATLLDFIIRLTGNPPEKLESILNQDTFTHLKDVPVSELSHTEQAELILLFSSLLTNKYYLFDNTATGMDREFSFAFMKLTTGLINQGNTVIYLTSSPEALSSCSLGKVHSLKYWEKNVQALKGSLETDQLSA
jgi:hypothetical protein